MVEKHTFSMRTFIVNPRYSERVLLHRTVHYKGEWLYLNFLETYERKLIWNNSLKWLNVCWKFMELTVITNGSDVLQLELVYLFTQHWLYFCYLSKVTITSKVKYFSKYSFQYLSQSKFNYLMIKYKSTHIFEMNHKLEKFQKNVA